MKNLEEFLTEGLFGGSQHKAPGCAFVKEEYLKEVKNRIEKEIKGAVVDVSDWAIWVSNVKGMCSLRIDVTYYDKCTWDKSRIGKVILNAYVENNSSKLIIDDEFDYALDKVIDYIKKQGINDLSNVKNYTPEAVKAELTDAYPNLEWGTSKNGYLQMLNIEGWRYANIVPESHGRFTLRVVSSGRTQRAIDAIFYTEFIEKVKQLIKKHGLS